MTQSARRPIRLAGSRSAASRNSKRTTFGVHELHGEVRPTLVIANFVELDNVCVAQTRHRLRFALKPLQFVWPRVGAGQHHLESDDAVEAQVTGPKNDTHAAQAKHCLDLVAGDNWKWNVPGLRRHRLRFLLGRWRKDRVEFGLHAAHFPPTPAHLRQEFRARPTNLFRRGVRIKQFFEQLSHARVVGHGVLPSSTGHLIIRR